MDSVDRNRRRSQGRSDDRAGQGSRPIAGVYPGRPSRLRAHEYKVLTAKDKYFDGKFDLTRLEEALNHFGRQGWTSRSMSTPHVKGFTGSARGDDRGFARALKRWETIAVS